VHVETILACSDLMTSSRIELQSGVPLRRIARRDAVVEALREAPAVAVVVDLTAFPDLPADLRNRGHEGAIIGFAPHVRTDLIEAAAPHCNQVLPRGAVARKLAQVLGIRSVSISDDSVSD
jgi:hypothetical protein